MWIVNIQKPSKDFFLHLFRDKYIKGHFVLNPIAQVVGYSSIKVDWEMKNLEEYILFICALMFLFKVLKMSLYI